MRMLLLAAWAKSYVPFNSQESSADEGDDASEKSASEVHDDEESVQVWLPCLLI